jgi:hypothetical protein
VRANPEVPSARQRPPLTKRLRARHWVVLDYLVGGVFGLILLASIRHSLVAAIEGPDGFVAYRPAALAWPLTLLLVFVAVIAVALRRRRPALMLGLLLAGSVIVTTLTGPENGGAVTYFLPVGYVLYLVAATYEDRQAATRVLVAVSATLLADTVLLYLTGGGYLGHGGMVSVALCVIIAWFTGYIVRQRRRYAVRLQDEAASKAVPGAAGAGVPGTAGVGVPGAAGDPASGADAAPLYPAPGLADLDRLVSRTAGAGVRVDVTRCGQPREMPASIDLSAYRIVQEALTNVVKHARTSSCQVLVGYGQDELVLEVIDNGAGVPADGAGVPAMAGAAAAHHGGSAVSSFADGGGFAQGGPAALLTASGPGMASSACASG